MVTVMRAILGVLTFPTLAAVVGAVLSVTGLHMVYAPLAFIVPGVALVAGGVWLALPRRN